MEKRNEERRMKKKLYDKRGMILEAIIMNKRFFFSPLNSNSTRRLLSNNEKYLEALNICKEI